MVKSVVAILLLVAAVFVPAGTATWGDGWIWLGLALAGWAVTYVALSRTNPALLKLRAEVGSGTPRWDRVLVPVGRILFLAIVIVAGLGVRYGWPALGRPVQALGIALFVAGYSLITWAMTVNAHFEGTVRIQTDRAHRVVDRGPYASVRHPGYAGFVLVALGTALVLRSGPALVPAALAVAWLFLRTALEDRFLRSGLAGYEEYARRVPCRLVPGLW